MSTGSWQLSTAKTNSCRRAAFNVSWLPLVTHCLLILEGGASVRLQIFDARADKLKTVPNDKVSFALKSSVRLGATGGLQHSGNSEFACVMHDVCMKIQSLKVCLAGQPEAALHQEWTQTQDKSDDEEGALLISWRVSFTHNALRHDPLPATRDGFSHEQTPPRASSTINVRRRPPRCWISSNHCGVNVPVIRAINNTKERGHHATQKLLDENKTENL